MMSMVCFFRWLKRGLWGLAAVVASAILVVFVVASLLVLRVDVTKRPKLLGNSPEVVERTVAATDPDDFTFRKGVPLISNSPLKTRTRAP